MNSASTERGSDIPQPRELIIRYFRVCREYIDTRQAEITELRDRYRILIAAGSYSEARYVSEYEILRVRNFTTGRIYQLAHLAALDAMNSRELYTFLRIPYPAVYAYIIESMDKGK